MHAWEAIQKTLDYIEDNLSHNLSMDTLAGVAALSPYYFQRLFTRLVKKPVYEYSKLRRLANAVSDLEKHEKRIIDIAIAYGFSNHANFTRAFKTAYGITPEEFRKQPVILNHFLKPDLLLNYVMMDEDVPLITEGIVIEVTRRRIIKPRFFLGVAGEVPIDELTRGKSTGVATTGQIWNEFHRCKHTITQLIPAGNEFGVLYMGEASQGCCFYLAGAETDDKCSLAGYTSFTLPGGEYAICCFEAESFSELIGPALYKASSFMDGWMQKHGLICGSFAAEMYYGSSPDSCYMEQWLPIDTGD